MLPRVKIKKQIRFLFKKKFDRTRHIVHCPHSRLAARQPNDVISVLAGPLKRRLAGLICIVHPTGCTTGCVRTAGYTTGCTTAVVQPVMQPVVKCEHRVTAMSEMQAILRILTREECSPNDCSYIITHTTRVVYKMTYKTLNCRGGTSRHSVMLKACKFLRN